MAPTHLATAILTTSPAKPTTQISLATSPAKLTLALLFALSFNLTAPIRNSPYQIAVAAPDNSNLAGQGIAPATIRGVSGVTYRLFPQGKLAFDFVVARPSPNDKNIFLCIPVAFTRHDNKIDGVAVSNGQTYQANFNSNQINRELGGAMLIENGHCKLLATNKGATLTKNFLDSVIQNKNSLFQQFLLVQDNKAAVFRDKSKFQRRAICKTSDGTFAVVESDKAITFEIFNNDLVAMKMKEALYADMGAWDEGWYRNLNGQIKKLGLDRSQTHRQSNWLLLREAKNR